MSNNLLLNELINDTQKDIKNYYNRFQVSDVKDKKALQDEILYQLFKKNKKDKNPPQIINPSDHKPNQIHQADILYMPNDSGYKYGLTVVDTGSRLTDCEPMKERTAKNTLEALKTIYKRGLLKIPQLSLEVDNGSEFKGVFSKYFKDKNINIRVAQTGRSRQQGLVESRNGTIATILLKRMIAEELITKEKSIEWIYYLPKLIKLINAHFYLKEVKLTPKEIMADVKTEDNENLLMEGSLVRVLLDKPVNIINGERLIGKFRAGDIRWSLKPSKIIRMQLIPNQPPLYKIEGYEPLYTGSQLQVITKQNLPPSDMVQKKFIVEKILEKKKIKNVINYLVKWKDYDKTTYEPRTNLIKDVPEIVSEYEKSIKTK